MEADANARIRRFVQPHFGGYEIADEDDLFALGFVNSLFAMQLVLFVEKEFGLTLGSDDLDFKNFRSVAAMSRLVVRKERGRAPDVPITPQV
ncbi:acyl carrier protein [Plantactinospora sp. ZYX-F-223]|uniref:acyl carrier protein n=1 Tax=Plantactinospora sp. ZYX-F-223 TaxID=3144103 RepID=UPI0031FCFD38